MAPDGSSRPAATTTNCEVPWRPRGDQHRRTDEALAQAYRCQVGMDTTSCSTTSGADPPRLLRSLVPKASRSRSRPGSFRSESPPVPGSFSPESLRTSGVEIYGAARNMATGMADAYQQVVDWVRSGELTIDVAPCPSARSRRRGSAPTSEAPASSSSPTDTHRRSHEQARIRSARRHPPRARSARPQRYARHPAAPSNPRRTSAHTGARTCRTRIGTTKPRRASSSPGRTGSAELVGHDSHE